MWVLLMVFLACFQMGFLLCDHGLDFEIGLCENSIKSIQSINQFEAFVREPQTTASYMAGILFIL